MKKKETKLVKPQGLKFPYESPQVKQKRLEHNEKLFKIAEQYGVHLARFDTDNSIFKTEEEKEAYERDVFLFSLLLESGKEIPQDLQERLLKVKKLKEQGI